MAQAHRLLRHARREAGLTQAQLAGRLGRKQASIARLEAPGANPTLATLDRALHATGRRLELSAPAHTPDVDEGQIVELLKLTPAQRLASFDASYRNVAELARKARRVDDDVA